jgi:hypothetical protein
MLSSQITVTPRLRRAAWIRWEVPMAAASPSPTTMRYVLSGWASLSPVATARARPWVAPKLSPPQVAKVCRPTQPMPVPKITSSCLRPSSSMACKSQFSIIPIPQPWQAFVGIWLGLKYFFARRFMSVSVFERGLCPRNPPGGGLGGGRRGPLRLSLRGRLSWGSGSASSISSPACSCSSPCSSAGFARAILLGEASEGAVEAPAD